MTEPDIEMKAEMGWMNRASLSSSMYYFQRMNAPAFRSPTEKFEMQARHAALELNMEDPNLTHFLETVVQKAKTFETVNGGALALLYHHCYDQSTGHLNTTAVKTFLKKLPTMTGLKKFVEEYGITPQDLVRYVRFYKDWIFKT